MKATSISSLWFILVSILLTGVSRAAKPTTKPSEMSWGDAVKGLRGSLQLAGRDQGDYHPGEPMDEWVLLQNTSSKVLRLPNVCEPTTHVRLPSGREVANFPPGQNPNQSFAGPDQPIDDVAPSQLAPEAMGGCLRMGDQPQGKWFEAGSGKPARVSFRAVGTYEIWFDFRLPANKAGIWEGDVVSNHVKINISELPPEKRINPPTAQQLAMLQNLVNGSADGMTSMQEVMKAMDFTENEGLAIHLVDLMTSSPDNPRAFFAMMLTERYGLPFDHTGTMGGLGAGIDGPYLEKLAAFSMVRAEGGGPKHPRFGGEVDAHPDMMALIAFLHFHPGKSDAQERAIAIAKRSANIAPDERKKRNADDSGHYVPEPVARRILVETGILHDGTTLEEATALLGPPTTNDPKLVVWSISPPLTPEREKRQIGATVAKGKLTDFQ